MLSFDEACIYLSRDKETREQVPETEEERHENGSNLVAWSEGNNHHSVKGEVDEAGPHEVHEQEEFSCVPDESNHCVKENVVYDSLNRHIYYLYGYLQVQHLRGFII